MILATVSSATQQDRAMFKHFMPNKGVAKKKRGRPAKNIAADPSDSTLASLLQGIKPPDKKSKATGTIEVYLLPSHYDQTCATGRRILHSKGCTRLRPQVDGTSASEATADVPDLYALEANEGTTELFAA